MSDPCEERLGESLRGLTEATDLLLAPEELEHALTRALEVVLRLMGQRAGWILLTDPAAQDRRFGTGFILAAHCGLSPEMAPGHSEGWDGLCECQRLCLNDHLDDAFNIIECSRIRATGRPSSQDATPGNPPEESLPESAPCIHASTALRAGGTVLGILNVVANDRAPFSPTALAVLTHAGRLMSMAVERARLLSIAEDRWHAQISSQEHLAEQLQMARQIQLSLLPGEAPEVPGWDFAATYRSAQVVGGDFYDYFYLPGTPLRLGVVIADVADKGVAAALYMALSRTVIRTSALSGRRPASVLVRANGMILSDSQTDMFLTACYLTLDLTTGRIVLANAGHNRPVVWSAESGQVREVLTRGLVLGAFEQIELEERETILGLGDVLLLYSDGVTDAINALEEPFGEERLVQVLVDHAGQSAHAIIRGILDALDSFAQDATQYDDVTLVVIRRQSAMPDEAIPTDWTHANFRSQRMPTYVRRRAV